MKKIKLILISIITLTTFSCSKSDSDTTVTTNAPETLYPSDYALKNTKGTTECYIYFGLLNNPFTSYTISSLLNQGSFSNKIIYTYSKPNGTILIGPKIQGSPTPTSPLVFKENMTYPFTIKGDKLTLTANGVNYILTLEP
jgi:hypothetical protein